MPEGTLGSQGEVTHCYARADRKGLLLFQYFTSSPGQAVDGGVGTKEGGVEREQRERGWIASLFFNLVFNLPLSTFYQSQVPLVHGH